jgi:predicted nucleic acid-binding protein
MRYLADTNILLRSVQPAHPMHRDAVRAVTILLASGNEVCVFNQSLIEFWNAATRDPDKNGLGLTPAQTDAEVRRIETLLMILPDHPAVYPEWRLLVVAHSVSGKQVHDTRIAAAMKVYGITHLLTFNGGDFKRFSHVTVVDPESIVTPPPQPAPIRT